MARKHKLLFAGLLIFLEVKWSLCISGKDLLHVAAVRYLSEIHTGIIKQYFKTQA